MKLIISRPQSTTLPRVTIYSIPVSFFSPLIFEAAVSYFKAYIGPCRLFKSDES